MQGCGNPDPGKGRGLRQRQDSGVEQVSGQKKGWWKTKGTCGESSPRTQGPEEWLPHGEESMERAGGSSELLEMLYGLIWVVGTRGATNDSL